MRKTKRNIRILQYNAVFEQESDGGYSVWVPSLSGCASQGDNFDEAVKNIKEAIGLYLEDRPETARDEDETAVKQFLIPISVSYA